MKTHLWRLSNVLLLTLCLQARIRAADGAPVWTNVFNGSGNNYDQAKAVAVDRNGNVVVTGYATGNGSGDGDYATIKYSAEGMPLWTNLFDGVGNDDDWATAVAVDGNGSVIVSGYSFGSGSGYDYATIKYSGAGAPLWTNLFNSGGNRDDRASAMAVDGNGNVIVTGSTSSNGIAGGYYATIKYSSSGVALWTNVFSGASGFDYQASAIAVDANSNVIFMGRSLGTQSNLDFATVKYTDAGAPMWTNLFNGAGNSDDYASAVAVDGSGNVIVTGYAFGTGSAFDYATIKYSSNGLPLWTNLLNNAENGNDYARAVAVDGSGSVIVTGYFFTGAMFGIDFATIKYSSAGVPLWTNLFNGPGDSFDEAWAVALDKIGNVYVTGSSMSSLSGFDYATIKYSGAGLPLWTNLFSSPGYSADEACSLAVDGSGNVIVTGYATDTESYRDYATIKYSGPLPPSITACQIVGTNLVSTVTGLTSGQELISSTSTNLMNWSPTQTNMASGSTLTITNPYSPIVTQQFYRILVQ